MWPRDQAICFIPCCYRAKFALLEATQKVTEELDLVKHPLVLNFNTLGNFSKSVLFAKVAEGESRERLIAMAGNLHVCVCVCVCVCVVPRGSW